MHITIKFAFSLLLFNITLCNYVHAQKFVIYDPDTGTELEPLQFLSGGLPAMWSPCKCIETVCSCMLGMKYGDGFDQYIGIYLTFVVTTLLVQFNIKYNGNEIVAFDVSAASPPPLCVPILLPIPALPCLNVRDVKIAAGTMSMCMTLNINILMIHTVEYQLGCLRYNNAKGVEFLDTIKEETPTTIDPDTDEDWGPVRPGVKL